MRSNLAGERTKDAEYRDIESIALEVTSGDQKWLFIGAYKPLNMNDRKFHDDFTMTCDKISKKYDNFMILGDMNFNMLDNNKSLFFKGCFDIFNIKNLIKKATCLTKFFKQSLLDVILTNNTNKCGKLCNFSCGLSEVQNMIDVHVKCERPNDKPKYKKCSSFKNFDRNEVVLRILIKIIFYQNYKM